MTFDLIVEVAAGVGIGCAVIAVSLFTARGIADWLDDRETKKRGGR